MEFWPVLVNFTVTSHQFFSNHVTTVANFEKIVISPDFIQNFRESHQVSKVSLKSFENCAKK